MAEDVGETLEVVEKLLTSTKAMLPIARKFLKENSPVLGETLAALWEALNEASKPCDKLYDKYMTGKARNVGYYLRALTKAGLTRKEAMQVIVAERGKSSAATRLPDINLGKKD
jgi:hypothetical protein